MIPTLQIMASRRDGGAERIFQLVVDGLNRAASGSAAAVVVPGSSVSRALAPGTPVHGLPMRGAWDLWSARAIRRLQRRTGVPLVQTWLGRATRLTRLRGRAVHVAQIGGFYDPAQYAHTDFCVATVPALADHLVRGGIEAARIAVIPNYTVEPRVVAPAEIAATKARLRIDGGAFVLLALARLHPVKGLDVLIDALAGLGSRSAEVVLLMVGDGPERAALAARVEERGLTARVHFVGWQQDAALWLQLADLVVMPSRSEGFGNVVIEAWANRRPVLASRAPGPAALISDGRDGVLVPIEHPDALGRAILELIGDPALRCRLAAAGRARFDADYGEAQVIGAYQALYHRLVG